MQRTLRILFSALFVFLVVPSVARAEIIHGYYTIITADTDGRLTIEELIVYDFEGVERHGIFRDIPMSYTRDGFHYRTRIEVTSVERVPEEGTDFVAEPYETSRSGGELHIRIGDPDTTVTGQQGYRIIYTVDRAINWFDGEPEVYWNAVGNGWDVLVEEAEVFLSGPAPIDPLRTSCYTGALGSQSSFCTLVAEDDGIRAVTDSFLAAAEGFTVVARLPVGSIPEPTAWDRTRDLLRDNWALALPVLALVVMIALYRRHGRDPRGRGTIIAEYEPPDHLSAAMLGYLIDERIDPRDITAALLTLAVKDHLSIAYEKKKLLGHTYRLTKRTSATALTPFEQGILDALPSDADGKTLDALKTTFPQKIAELKKLLQQEAKDNGFFQRAPESVRATYFGIGTALTVIGAFIFFPALETGSVATGLGVFFSGIIVLSFASAMPQRTTRGVERTEHIKGFREFLSVTETERLAFHNSPKRTPEQFFTFLPYAIALSVEREWAGQFRDLTIEQPEWYTGGDATAFNAAIFATSMRDFSRTTQQQAFTPPAKSGGSGGSGFGGGGFSGGGFGGGGGGSW